MNSVHWSCFIDYREAMYHVPVMAISAEHAAVEAAIHTGIAGTWTVVQGEAVEVNTTEKKIYGVDHG